VKRIFLLIAILLLFITAGLVFYLKYYSGKVVSIWDLIPNQTVAVYEPGDCPDCVKQFKESVLLQLANRMNTKNESEDTLLNSYKDLVSAKSGLISLHLTQKDNFDFVYYLPESNAGSFISQLRKKHTSETRSRQHEFNGVIIYETFFGDRLLSWTSINRIWVGSYSSLLIEDVVRTYNTGGNQSFLSENPSINSIPTIKGDAGNLYINLKLIQSWINLFTENSVQFPLIGNLSLLDIKPTENSIVLNGFSFEGSEKSGRLSLFKEQSPVSFNHKNLISNRALLVVNYGISNSLSISSKLTIHTNKPLQDTLATLTESSYSELFSSLGKEITICSFESRNNVISNVLLIETSDIAIWNQALQNISRFTERTDSVYLEKYSTYQIRKIDYENFPEKLFKPLVTGFKQTYYTTLGSTIVLAERLDELRLFLNDIDIEEVWGKSVATNQFLESTLLESNMSLYINTPRALNFAFNKLNPKWKENFNRVNRNQFSKLGFSAFQLSNLNQNYYTNIVFSFDKSGILAEKLPSENKIQTNIDQPFTSKPFLVRNHATKNDEFVIQDSLNTIHYLSSSGVHQWRKSIDGKLVDEIRQVDFLSNNKLQLFLVSGNRIHIIDRLGNYVNPFPVIVRIPGLEFSNVIDYDNSKNYRYLLTDQGGKLWLFDKEGKQLSGWNPRNLDGSVLSSPNHYRVGGKDFFLAIRKDGVAYLMNRRAENSKGFPLKLDIKPEGSYFVDAGNDLSSAMVIVVSGDGSKVKFSFDGKIVSKELLVKAAVDDKFSLITDRVQKSYIIKRQNSRQLSVLNEDGKVLLNNDFIGPHRTEVQYYDFGSGRTYITITDLDDDLCYVYDGSGSLLTPLPLQASGVVLKMDGARLVAAMVKDRTFTLHPLQ
jgi:hypothetical protein